MSLHSFANKTEWRLARQTKETKETITYISYMPKCGTHSHTHRMPDLLTEISCSIHSTGFPFHVLIFGWTNTFLTNGLFQPSISTHSTLSTSFPFPPKCFHHNLSICCVFVWLVIKFILLWLSNDNNSRFHLHSLSLPLPHSRLCAAFFWHTSEVYVQFGFIFICKSDICQSWLDLKVLHIGNWSS